MTVYFEISAAVLGLVQSVLVMLNLRSNWIFYIAQMVCLLLFSLSVSLYGDVINCLIYLLFGVWGFLLWKPSRQGISVSIYTNTQRAVFLAGLCIAVLLLGSYLRQTNDPLPFLDALTTASSFLASYFMVRRKLEAWVVWFFNDILYIAVYFMLEEQAWYLLALNSVWTVMAVLTYLNWKRIMVNKNG